MPGEHLDLTSGADEDRARPALGPRKFVGIQFACCDCYGRIYVNADGTAYTGYCPKCARPVRIRIGPGGTDNRFFVAY